MTDADDHTAHVLAATLPLACGTDLHILAVGGSGRPAAQLDACAQYITDALCDAPPGARTTLLLPSPKAIQGAAVKRALMRRDTQALVAVSDAHADAQVHFLPMFPALSAMYLGSTLSQATATDAPDAPPATTAVDAVSARAILAIRALIDARGGGGWDLLSLERPPEATLGRLPLGLSFGALVAFVVTGWTLRLPPSPSASNPFALLPPLQLVAATAFSDWATAARILRTRLALGLERVRAEATRLRSLEGAGDMSGGGYFGGLHSAHLFEYAQLCEAFHKDLLQALEDGHSTPALRRRAIEGEAALDLWVATHAGAMGGPIAVLGRDLPPLPLPRKRRTVLELIYGCGFLGAWAARCDARLAWLDDGEDAAFAADALAAGLPASLNTSWAKNIPSAQRQGAELTMLVQRGGSARTWQERRAPLLKGGMGWGKGGSIPPTPLTAAMGEGTPLRAVAIVPIEWLPSILASWPHGDGAPPPIAGGWCTGPSSQKGGAASAANLPPPPRPRTSPVVSISVGTGEQRTVRTYDVGAQATYHPLVQPLYTHGEALLWSAAPVIGGAFLLRNRALIPSPILRTMRLCGNAALAIGGGTIWLTLALHSRLSSALGGEG